MAAIEVKVPDIGDFKDVPVIEVLVKPGDAVKKDDSLVTLESDKATMEVPAPSSGTVKEIRVKVGDKVSQGVAILTMEAALAAGTGRPSAGAVPAQAGSQAPTPAQTGASLPAKSAGPSPAP
ncbi:MAG: biotin/lipoyl-containing protein, partial [Usitatibacter sp.]